MKLRVGFVTNSSSNSYIVKNITESTKTMLDLLQEASTDDFGPWQLMPECYLLNWEDYQDEDACEEYPSDRPKDHVGTAKFLEDVANVKSFPPHQAVEVRFEWANVEGYIILAGETKSFEIEEVPM
jgi:hypothetical protein